MKRIEIRRCLAQVSAESTTTIPVTYQPILSMRLRIFHPSTVRAHSKVSRLYSRMSSRTYSRTHARFVAIAIIFYSRPRIMVWKRTRSDHLCRTERRGRRRRTRSLCRRAVNYPSTIDLNTAERTASRRGWETPPRKASRPP